VYGSGRLALGELARLYAAFRCYWTVDRETGFYVHLGPEAVEARVDLRVLVLEAEVVEIGADLAICAADVLGGSSGSAGESDDCREFSWQLHCLYLVRHGDPFSRAISSSKALRFCEINKVVSALVTTVCRSKSSDRRFFYVSCVLLIEAMSGHQSGNLRRKRDVRSNLGRELDSWTATHSGHGDGRVASRRDCSK
jgi:hypothetical protein